ncbi:hypothetical protein N9L06_07025 [Mariniblastus sp.]|nr:hypothetical protein [Mariniblastus sp.]
MNEFIKLREVAAARRDAAIKKAKDEHALTVRKIAELEGRIRGTRKPRARIRPKTTLADLIYSVLPNDRPFCLDDVRGLVKSAEPDRERSKATINTNLSRMLRAGSIKRIRRSKTGKPALFALIDYDAPEARTMLDWAKDVEGWESMEPVEIMVKMTEAGYQMDVPPREAVKSLSRELNR